jgi:hypothetical protein
MNANQHTHTHTQSIMVDPPISNEVRQPLFLDTDTRVDTHCLHAFQALEVFSGSVTDFNQSFVDSLRLPFDERMHRQQQIFLQLCMDIDQLAAAMNQPVADETLDPLHDPLTFLHSPLDDSNIHSMDRTAAE